MIASTPSTPTRERSTGRFPWLVPARVHPTREAALISFLRSGLRRRQLADAKKSGAWLRLALKKMMGLNLGLAMQPLARKCVNAMQAWAMRTRGDAEILHNHP